MENINNFFKPPIFYNHAKKLLSLDIIRDLELVETIDPSNQSLYAYCFNLKKNNQDNQNNASILSNKAIEQLSKYYTTDTNFIKDNQKLLKQLKFKQTQNNDYIKYSNHIKK